MGKYIQGPGDIAPSDQPKGNPFKSAKQRRYMWAKKPKLAKKWTKKYGSKIRYLKHHQEND